MAFSGKSSSDSGMAALIKSLALQARKSSLISGAISVHDPILLGTGFETLPPLAISTNLLKFLKCMDLKSVGLGLSYVPFHSGWELIEWVPKSVDLGQNWVEILEICDVVEVDGCLGDFWPQIELDLGEGSSIHDVGEPPVEDAEMAPTVVVEVEEEFSVEVFEASASVEKMRDQAGRTVDETVHDTVQQGTGVEPVLMDVDERLSLFLKLLRRNWEIRLWK